MLTLLGLGFAAISVGDPVARLIIAMTALICVPLFLILDLSSLKSELDAEGIHLNFRPFTKKYFAWSDVQSAEIVNYGFVGGWGIRIGTKYGTVYNTQGKEGLWLTLKNGKKVVIGTQRKAAMQAAVKRFFG